MTAHHFILLLFSFGALQGLLLSALLRLKYKDTQVNYLSLICLLFSLMMLYYVAFWSRVSIPRSLVWIQHLTFLIGPLFYEMAKATPFQLSFRAKNLLHFTAFPLIVVLLYSRVPPFVMLVAQPLHLVVYAILTITHYDTKHKSLTWLAASLAGYAAMFVVYTIMVFTRTLTLAFDYLISAVMCGFIYSLMVLSYLKPRLFEQLKAGSQLSTALVGTVMERIHEHFKTNKPYLNGDYRLSDLSSELSVKPYQLSEIINSHYDGFQQLVNDYRIQESKELLRKTPNKIIDVAFMSGFNNKVSFFKAFRKTTGMTPVEWREKKVNVYMG